MRIHASKMGLLEKKEKSLRSFISLRMKYSETDALRIKQRKKIGLAVLVPGVRRISSHNEETQKPRMSNISPVCEDDDCEFWHVWQT